MSKKTIFSMVLFLAGLIALLVWIFDSDKSHLVFKTITEENLLVSLMVLSWGLFILIVCNTVYKKIRYQHSHNSPID